MSTAVTSVLLFFCRRQKSAAARRWTQGRAGTTRWSGIMTPLQTPALSSGMEVVKETATSLRLRRAAEKPVWRVNYSCSHKHTWSEMLIKHFSVISRDFPIKFTSTFSVFFFLVATLTRRKKQRAAVVVLTFSNVQ